MKLSQQLQVDLKTAAILSCATASCWAFTRTSEAKLSPSPKAKAYLGRSQFVFIIEFSGFTGVFWGNSHDDIWYKLGTDSCCYQTYQDLSSGVLDVLDVLDVDVSIAKFNKHSAVGHNFCAREFQSRKGVAFHLSFSFKMCLHFIPCRILKFNTRLDFALVCYMQHFMWKIGVFNIIQPRFGINILI